MRRVLAAAAVALLVACGSSAPPLHEQFDPKAFGLDQDGITPAPAPSGSTAAAKPACRGTATGEDGGAPQQIAARHVLIQWMGAAKAGPSVVRTRDQARQVAEQVLKRARGGEDFARLATEYSDEPGAGARGGALGCFGHGVMDKQFEAAAFALKPGEISDVVESAFGYHIIQRTE